MSRSGGILVAMALTAILGASGLLHPLDMRVLDVQFRVLRALAPPQRDASVVVVGFDETTASLLHEPLALWHGHLGKFVQAAAAGRAAVIGLDVVLPDRSLEALAPGQDRKLLTGLILARRATPIVLALTVDPSGNTRPIYPAFAAAAGTDALGYALLPLDSDGAARSFDEHIEINGRHVPTLVGQMARRMGKPAAPGLIDYARGGSIGFIPLQDVLDWWETGNQAKLHQAFAGKAVLLGSVLKYEDRQQVAVNLLEWDPASFSAPGVVLHAQILRNLLGSGLIRPASWWLPSAMAALAVLAWCWSPRPLLAASVVGVLTLLSVVASTLSLYAGVQLPVIGAILVMLFASGTRQAIEAHRGLHERRRLRAAFGGYVSPPVMDEILSGRLNPVLGGEQCFTCVMFSDIRGYTSRSEHTSPQQAIAFLNAYFERVVPIIHSRGGTVVSFMGDGIMAVFGAPQPLDNPCQYGFNAAVDILALRRLINAELEARDEPELEIGIGLHAGVGVAGHIGAVSRHEYSLIGDVTNVASRLEGLSKEVGFRLVCSRVVFEQLKAGSGLAPLSLQAIKGHSPIETFGLDPVDANRGPPSLM